jgi:hypothetical protein
MNKVVPHSTNYKTNWKVGGFASFLLYTAALISIVALINDKADLFESKELINKNLNSTLAILAILYFLLDLVHNYLFHQAELNRKNDFVDNSFQTKLADENSQGYFSNDSFPSGIYKLGVNGFENSFFTKAVSSKMIIPSVIKSLVILILILLVVFFTDQTVLVAVVQIALPFIIFQQTIRLILFHSQIKNIVDNYKHIFDAVNTANRDALIVSNVINYEKSLSWSGIQLDSKLFDKLNPKLTHDWEALKVKYNI